MFKTGIHKNWNKNTQSGTLLDKEAGSRTTVGRNYSTKIPFVIQGNTISYEDITGHHKVVKLHAGETEIGFIPFFFLHWNVT